jgi:hypothetical protein
MEEVRKRTFSAGHSGAASDLEGEKLTPNLGAAD